MVPTPRGGGIGIIVSLYASLGVLVATQQLELHMLLALAGGLPIAAVGLADDRLSLGARWRLLAQLAGTAWGLYWLGGMPPFSVGPATYSLGWAGHLLATVGIVWMVNLFNFMDGIDGIAGVEAIFVAGGTAALNWAIPGLSSAPTALATASVGFLLWNWPPARIFMGDVGSAPIGFFIGIFTVANARHDTIWPVLILFGYFLVDAGVTLVRRIARKEKWYAAHRSHAYQHAAQRWGHRAVTLTLAAVNGLWLCPWAWAATRYRSWALAITIAALLPLFVIVVRLGAGTRKS